MIQTGLIQNAHSDLVTDASYDFYGLRLATCSLDQRIKIWQLDESTGNWTVEDEWKAHDAAVTKVSWAHPEFGTIIASSSFDRTVKIWEQTSYAEIEQSQVNGASSSASTSRWTERAVLVDAKFSVRAVEFAPQHFGLKLATVSSDNHLRIYECLEQPSLATWQLAEEVDVLSLPSSSPTSNSVSQTVTLATPTQTTSTLDGASVSLAAQALQQQQQQSQGPSRPGLGNREADGGWCISWCKDKYWGEVIAAGCGIDGKIKIIQLSPSHRPATLLTLSTAPLRSVLDTGKPPPTPIDGEALTYAITSVSWAPSCGRSYHLIATGSRDGKVRIWRIKPPALSDEVDLNGDADGEEAKWTGSIVGEFDDHKSSVGRVEWNITGTVLSSAGNDGKVRLWKATAGNVWRPAGHIGVEQADEQPPDVDMDHAIAD
ncbi:WD40 repeat-like protein [Cristinia sonorae]|uniref:WD40 repeat-like protein n=1 Tax=Cristinia sonorae TaxID=1940300 RepID=A0A8K0XQZ6_9AGAR|nr:WD40 repeat-like protein [Cristinia sonorae]